MKNLKCLTAATLCAAAPALAEGPSFDCAKSDSDATDAICASPALSALDREMSRLYGLAVTGPNMTEDRKAELKAYQRGWIGGRDECWKANDLDSCVRDNYGMRIHELREGYADARAEEGGSTGPFAYVCDGIDAGISAVFVQAGDPLVSLKWRNSNVVLPIAESGSGSKYEQGDTVFWIKGDQATFTLDGTAHACHQDDIG